MMATYFMMIAIPAALFIFLGGMTSLLEHRLASKWLLALGFALTSLLALPGLAVSGVFLCYLASVCK